MIARDPCWAQFPWASVSLLVGCPAPSTRAVGFLLHGWWTCGAFLAGSPLWHVFSLHGGLALCCQNVFSLLSRSSVYHEPAGCLSPRVLDWQRFAGFIHSSWPPTRCTCPLPAGLPGLWSGVCGQHGGGLHSHLPSPFPLLPATCLSSLPPPALHLSAPACWDYEVISFNILTLEF